MYKVFINDRVIKLTDNFEDYDSSYNTLFIHYKSQEALIESLELIKNSDVVSELCIYDSDLDYLWNKFCEIFKIIEAAGGIVLKEDKVLMILKNNHWDLPKGKLDGNEAPKDAALREVSEECGLNELAITGDLDTTYYLYREKSQMVLKKTNWFQMSSRTDGPLKGDESEGIVDVKWINAGEWQNLASKSYPSVIKMLSSIF